MRPRSRAPPCRRRSPAPRARAPARTTCAAAVVAVVAGIVVAAPSSPRRRRCRRAAQPPRRAARRRGRRGGERARRMARAGRVGGARGAQVAGAVGVDRRAEDIAARIEAGGGPLDDRAGAPGDLVDHGAREADEQAVAVGALRKRLAGLDGAGDAALLGLGGVGSEDDEVTGRALMQACPCRPRSGRRRTDRTSVRSAGR